MSIRRAFFDKNQFFCLTRHILLVQHYEFSIFDTNLDMVFQSSGVRASDDFFISSAKIDHRKGGKAMFNFGYDEVLERLERVIHKLVELQTAE